MIEFLGEIPDEWQRDLQTFAQLVETHRWGGPVNGRLIAPDAHPDGLRSTMHAALAKWMKDDVFADWSQLQVNRPVAPAGKVFIADDEIPTAVVAPLSDRAAFLNIAAHELLELAKLDHANFEPEDARSFQGLVLAEEYALERARLEIIRRLPNWPQSRLDARVEIVRQTDEIVGLLRLPPHDGPPTRAFWQHWVGVGQMWAMMAGRADAGFGPAARELDEWAKHDLIADDGWSPLRHTASDLYQQPDLDRYVFAEAAARGLWDPLEAYGRRAWTGA